MRVFSPSLPPDNSRTTKIRAEGFAGPAIAREKTRGIMPALMLARPARSISRRVQLFRYDESLFIACLSRPVTTKYDLVTGCGLLHPSWYSGKERIT